MSNNNNNVTVSQLEQYKLEKKLKFEREKAAEEDLRKENEIAAIAVAKEQAERKAESLASIARIQFRLPDGSIQSNSIFSSRVSTIRVVYICQEWLDK